MTNVITIAFDGTGNDPSDGKNGELFKSYTSDNSISNVLKLHLLLGGNLHQDERYGQNNSANISKSFYYQGVGTYGSWFSQAINQGLAPDEHDIASILRKAKADLVAHYTVSQPILIIGFSRGAALARRFATIISDMVTPHSVYLLVFDTVASIGLPNLSTRERPKFDVVFEHGHTLSKSVISALHLVSLDEKRKAFQPTLMNYEPERVNEIWFAGAHSDVGGGYFYDGLSDITLSVAIDWLKQMQSAGLPQFVVGELTNHSLIAALPQALQQVISLDSLNVNGDATAISHEQTRTELVSKLTLDDRQCVVVNNNQMDSSLRPQIHKSVIERLSRVLSYQPKSLAQCAHQVFHDFFQTSTLAHCFTEHKALPSHPYLTPLEHDQSVTLCVYANLFDNHSGILLEKGQRYLISANPLHVWFDNQLPVSAKGWTRDEVSLGLKELVIKVNEDNRRLPNQNWLALCARTYDQNEPVFIGEEAIFSASHTAELLLFANHIADQYQHNAGAIEVTITKI